MPKHLRHRLRAIALVLAFVSVTVGCRNTATEAEPPAAAKATFSGEYPIQVVCTTGPVTDLVLNVGGEHLAVFGLMGPGVDPHLYSAVPTDIERLLRADMIFYNGMHLEGRMADLLEKLAARKPAFAVTQGLVTAKDTRLRRPPEFDGYYDPHVWHDPRLWAESVKHVAGVLAEYDPQNRDDYIRNRDEYLAELDKADRYAREQLETVPAEQRVLVTAHDAFDYFCTAYGLESMPLKGVSTEDEVTIGRMDVTVALLVERKIKAVFVESAAAPQIVEALIKPCQRAGHEVRIGGELYADALGPADSGADNYLGMFKANVDTIVSALK
jgi:manganese/zinc/iron transport system substrate-binding protein